MTDRKEYYIVRVMLEKDGRDAFVFPRRWEYLALDGGYMSHSAIEAGAQRFESPPTAEYIAAYSGCPWYDVHVVDYPPQIFRVVETRTVERLS